jgi:Protein tyrosine and serine/threonine kinase
VLRKTLQRTVLNRRRPPSAPADGPLPLAPASPGVKLPRRFGDFLLTSRIDEDALGHVYRAMSLGDNRDFVRLHVFDSPELARMPLADTLRTNNWYVGTLSGGAIARGIRMGSVLGAPYLAWSESHGWPLHALTGALRLSGRRLSMEHAILIADRIAAGLESAQKTKLDRRPVLHGLVWPGFVSIGEHGDVRIAGFGIAPAILPVVTKERLSQELAPYLAPEERSENRVGINSDVYAVGAILLELLTGRQPGAQMLRADVRSDDAFPQALARVLRVCFAPAELRFPSLSSFRRELGKVVVAEKLELSSYRLAADLRALSSPPVAASAAREESAREAPTDAEIDRTLEAFWKRLNI